MRCAVSVDLDAIGCYYQIHGLGPAPIELEHVILARALPRAAALFARHKLRITWFVIGRDVDRDRSTSALPGECCAPPQSGSFRSTSALPGECCAPPQSGSFRSTSALPGECCDPWKSLARDAPPQSGSFRAAPAQQIDYLRELAAAGDELANHSYTHPYNLARLPPAAIADEIEHCDRVLRALAGPVRGFRAPGYDVSPAMFDVLARLGYRYDSSVFPSPGYYAAKAVVVGALAALRRPSGAVLTNPRLLAAPPEPYRPAMTAPWRRGQAPLVELPIATTPGLRVHAIGTSLVLAPPWLRARLIEQMARRGFWNLEFHGIDFADAAQDGLPGELVARQPDLRIPIDDKIERFDRVLEEVTRRWDTARLADVAVDVQREA